MNQTEQYALNQWASADRIRMQDFNADNLKVEQALGQLDAAVTAEAAARAAGDLWVKLADYTLPSDTESVDLNLSAIPITDYAELRLRPYLNWSGRYCHVRVNHLTSGYNNGFGDNTVLERFGTHADLGIVRMSLQMVGSSLFSAVEEFPRTGTSAGRGAMIHPISALNTLTLYASDGVLKAGGRIVLYGLRL